MLKKNKISNKNINGKANQEAINHLLQAIRAFNNDSRRFFNARYKAAIELLWATILPNVKEIFVDWLAHGIKGKYSWGSTLLKNKEEGPGLCQEEVMFTGFEMLDCAVMKYKIGTHQFTTYFGEFLRIRWNKECMKWLHKSRSFTYFSQPKEEREAYNNDPCSDKFGKEQKYIQAESLCKDMSDGSNKFRKVLECCEMDAFNFGVSREQLQNENEEKGLFFDKLESSLEMDGDKKKSVQMLNYIHYIRTSLDSKPTDKGFVEYQEKQNSRYPIKDPKTINNLKAIIAKRSKKVNPSLYAALARSEKISKKIPIVPHKRGIVITEGAERFPMNVEKT